MFRRLSINYIKSRVVKMRMRKMNMIWKKIQALMILKKLY